MPKNEVDDFLEGLNNEPNQDPFNPVAEDPFATKEEPATKETEKEEEKPLPFHKDPKVQRFIEKELTKRISEIKPTEQKQFEKQADSESEDLVGAFTAIIGNDTPEKVHALKMLGKSIEKVRNDASAEAMQAMQDRAEEERQVEIQAQEELTQALEDIEEEHNIDLTSNTSSAKKMRGEFIDFVKRVSPKDKDGQVTQFPDFQETFVLFKETRKSPENSRAKELSSRSMQRSADASTTKVTGKSWKDIDRLFSNL